MHDEHGPGSERIQAALKQLYSSLTPDEIEEARHNLARYGHLALRIFLSRTDVEEQARLNQSEAP